MNDKQLDILLKEATDIRILKGLTKMKVIAYITKCIPVEVEVDDKWKPMEDYGNHVDGTTKEEDRYFDEHVENFQKAVIEKLSEMDEDFSADDLCAVWTEEDNYIFEV